MDQNKIINQIFEALSLSWDEGQLDLPVKDNLEGFRIVREPWPLRGTGLIMRFKDGTEYNVTVSCRAPQSITAGSITKPKGEAG